MTTDLVAFLRERLDEDEQMAREAQDRDTGRWFVGDKWNVYDELDQSFGEGDESNSLITYGNAKPLSEHIARHDPARVLAEVAAKRQILALHPPVVLRGGAGARYFDTTTVCRSCEPPQFPEHAFPCPTLRLLALPYADHPDYQPEWAPST